MKFKNIFKYLIGNITHCYNYGKNNKVVFVKNGKERKRLFLPRGLKVVIIGSNSTVSIEEPLKFDHAYIGMDGSKAEFSIKSSKFHVREATFYIGEYSKVKIGKDSQLKNTGLMVIANGGRKDKPVTIDIGNNVYIARDCLIRSSDGHTLIDVKTKEPINEPQNVVIEDNVWITSKCVILKGSHIPKGCVVGACSLVNKKFEEGNSLIAGSPAKIIKHDITWDSHNYIKYVDDVYNNLKEKSISENTNKFINV